MALWSDCYLLLSTSCEGPLMADSVEKVGRVLHDRKVRAWDWNLYFEQWIPGSHFAQQRAKKAFSAVSIRAVWKNRLFQQNRPITACCEGLRSQVTDQERRPSPHKMKKRSAVVTRYPDCAQVSAGSFRRCGQQEGSAC